MDTRMITPRDRRLHNGDQPLGGRSLGLSTDAGGIVTVELMALFPLHVNCSRLNFLFLSASDHYSVSLSKHRERYVRNMHFFALHFSDIYAKSIDLCGFCMIRWTLA